ncbi:MAG: ATP-dependent Clp protease adaptor protein ClpS [Cyclobacteriaceae bacterium]|jgi:ATP-dependent Clp protease adaptor protein ClpS
MITKNDISPEVEELTIVEEDVDVQDPKKLIVHNDDFNTFEHVINTLVKVCKHDQLQAEQCTYIIHYRGKCSVKEGQLIGLRPLREAICEAGIKATID